MSVTSLALIVYGVGVVVGLWLTDARPVTRVALAVLWPIGPIAFGLTLCLLAAAVLVAFPLVGFAVTLAIGGWFLLAR